MRSLVLWLLLAAAAAEYAEDWTEEDLEQEDPFNVDEDVVFRRKRDVHDQTPFEEHVRVKRCCSECEQGKRSRRSADYVRSPRQVHQYEVHEVTDDAEPSSAPYEEMLAAASEHFHRVYAPGPTARHLHADVSSLHRDANNFANPVPSALPLYNNPQKLPEAAKLVQPSPDSPLHSVSPAQFTHAPAPLPVFVAPAEVPVVRAAPAVPLQQLAGDQAPAAGHHHHQQSQSHKQGAGHAHHAQHQGQHGGKTVKGFKQDHYVDKGGKGHKTDEHHRKEYEEAAGKKKKHHDHAGHKGSHEEEAHGHRGAHFDEKKGHKKGHKTKGYHNKYHKDEFHKEHKFYDDFHKSGEHHRYGKFNAKHASNESGKKKAHHVNAGHDFVERGKKGYSNKGHVDADHKGHEAKQGHEEHHQHHSSHGKKGGKEGGSHWGYAKKN